MQKLAREEAKDAAKDKEARLNKRQKTAGEDEAGSEDDQPSDDQDYVDEDGLGAELVSASEDEGATPPPMHESLAPDTNSDLAKSQRTVFLGNVSTTAITSKSAQKTLMNHLSSFFPSLDAPSKGQPKHKIESLRFRSTAYASALPKKAAFAKKELMDATTKSTNAYAIYSSQALAREAARRLNGTVVLDRHIRVDEVAHPAKTDNKRCVFVGNLGFVDDETNIDKANEEEGKGKRQGKKTPSDVEEGLWRTFASCGTVESVRVVRDSKTRVGKGIAYVQFTVCSLHLQICSNNNANHSRMKMESKPRCNLTRRSSHQCCHVSSVLCAQRPSSEMSSLAPRVHALPPTPRERKEPAFTTQSSLESNNLNWVALVGYSDELVQRKCVVVPQQVQRWLIGHHECQVEVHASAPRRTSSLRATERVPSQERAGSNWEGLERRRPASRGREAATEVLHGKLVVV